MAHRNQIIKDNSSRNNGNNSYKRIQKVSSIDCVLSDDDETSNNESNSANIDDGRAAGPHAFVTVGDIISSRSSMNNNDGDLIYDDASLYVNAKTVEDFSSNNNYSCNYYNIRNTKNPRRGITDHNDGRALGGNIGVGERVERGGVGTGRVVAFRGLSKSASRLLSQDRQTLSELLDVDGGAIMNNDDGAGGIDMNNIGDIGGGGVEDIDEGNHQQADDPNMAMIREEQETLMNNNNVNEGYLYYHIQQLEEKYRAQNEEMTSLKREWESKLIEQEQVIEEKYKNEVDNLRKEIKTLRKTIDIGNDRKGGKHKSIMEVGKQLVDNTDTEAVCSFPNLEAVKKAQELVSKLTPDQISRYSRQLLLNDGFGVKGQQKLLSSSVLVIGAGGIGSTLLLYLAASGIGKIVVVDFDVVEKSNLHRQVIHCEAHVGMNKAVSACLAMKKLNPSIECIPIEDMLTYENALDIISTHNCDCIVDACDNPKTRYLCNDASIMAKKPLVSGSAMGTEGQLTVYGMNDNSGCYRCLYPKMNPSEGCKSCSDNGVLGTVPGLIGILQATETLKVLTGVGASMHDRLLMYDSMRCTFMNIKKPPRRKNCIVCGPNAKLKNMEECRESSSEARGPQPQQNQERKASGNTVTSNSIPQEMNVSCKEYEIIRKNGESHLLLDVRVQKQYEMCSLSGSVNIELGKIESNLDSIEAMCCDGKPIYCICRRGVASVEAARLISEKSNMKVYNISGGYNSWVAQVDSSFPKY